MGSENLESGILEHNSSGPRFVVTAAQVLIFLLFQTIFWIHTNTGVVGLVLSTVDQRSYVWSRSGFPLPLSVYIYEVYFKSNAWAVWVCLHAKGSRHPDEV